MKENIEKKRIENLIFEAMEKKCFQLRHSYFSEEEKDDILRDFKISLDKKYKKEGEI